MKPQGLIPIAAFYLELSQLLPSLVFPTANNVGQCIARSQRVDE